MKSVLQTILIPLVFLLAVWVCLERAVDSPLILPGPAAVLQRAWQLLCTARFRAQLAATLGRVLVAFAVSVLLSVLIGSVQAFVPAAERFLRIPFAFVKAAPVVSFILIALFWFTTGTVPVFVAVVMTMPVITASVYKGLTTTDKKLLDMCRVYGFSRAQTVKWCYIPSAMPVFSAGAVTAFAQTWKVVVAAEVISLPQKALGTAMQTAKVHLETADVFAITLILVAVSFILESAFRNAITVIPDKTAVIPNLIRDPTSSEMLKQVQHDSIGGQHDNRAAAEPAQPRIPEPALRRIPELVEGSVPVEASQSVEVTISSFTSVRGGRTIYRNFSHTFAAGSVTALVAPSGAGKTTLLDYIAGLLPDATDRPAAAQDIPAEPKVTPASAQGTPTDFATSSEGQSSRRPVESSRLHNTVSYIFQEPRLLPSLNVVQNIAAPLYRTLGKSAATERALQLLQQVGLTHKAGSRVTDLSGGEKQRVALARAFAYPAPVFLMDEAFQSQDLNLRLQLLQLFEQLQFAPDASRTVIMATHDIKEALTLADTVLVLKPRSEFGTGTDTGNESSNGSNTGSGYGISEPALTLPLPQNRAISARSRYLTGNAELEQKILQSLL